MVWYCLLQNTKTSFATDCSKCLGHFLCVRKTNYSILMKKSAFCCLSLSSRLFLSYRLQTNSDEPFYPQSWCKEEKIVNEKKGIELRSYTFKTVKSIPWPHCWSDWPWCFRMIYFTLGGWTKMWNRVFRNLHSKKSRTMKRVWENRDRKSQVNRWPIVYPFSDAERRFYTKPRGKDVTPFSKVERLQVKGIRKRFWMSKKLRAITFSHICGFLYCFFDVAKIAQSISCRKVLGYKHTAHSNTYLNAWMTTCVISWGIIPHWEPAELGLLLVPTGQPHSQRFQRHSSHFWKQLRTKRVPLPRYSGRS